MSAYVGVLGIDWIDCPAVEVVPGKVSGVPILKHTRMQADSVIENYDDGMSVDEIAEAFELPKAAVRQVVEYANQRNPPEVA